MSSQVKQLFFTITFNFALFFILMIGIQNSSDKSKINFLVNETINLPTGFIVGMSFITGTLTGSLIITNLRNKSE